MQLSLNVPPTPYMPPQTFFWIKAGSKNKNIYLRDLKNPFLKYGF